MLTIPKCEFCERYRYDEESNNESCVAFPNGIPNNVMWDQEEKECNEGIKFKLDE